MRTLVALLPADTLPAVVSEVLGVLGQSELRTVTAEEHAIYTTPEGTLFNKAVLSRLGPPPLQNCRTLAAPPLSVRSQSSCLHFIRLASHEGRLEKKPPRSLGVGQLTFR